MKLPQIRGLMKTNICSLNNNRNKVRPLGSCKSKSKNVTSSMRF
uniref:Uncharacterized protein n=1 Tax=Musa acuminata subsp. malaccensis TaxID=214687 RepID=A0A804L2C1_MUSAM